MRATPARRRLHRMRLLLEGLAALVIIGTALVVGSVGLLLPWLVNHPARVEAFLSESLKQPVDIREIQGDWTVAGPVFTLNDMRLGDPAKGPPFHIARAELAIDFYAWLKREVSFSEFRIVGLVIDAAKGADGHWRVARLGGESSPASADSRVDILLDLVTASVRNARISLTDAASGRRLQFSRVDARIVNTLAGRRFGGVLWTENDSPPMRFACELDRSNRGRCYLEGKDLEPARWLAQFPIAGIVPVAGKVDARVWVDLGERGARAAQLELESQDLALRGVEAVVFGDGDAIEPRFALPGLRMAARWQRRDSGWDLDLLDWRGADANAAPATSLRLARRQIDGKARYGMVAPSIELGYWLPFLALAQSAPPKLRSVVYENSPRGSLHDVELRLRGGRYELSARADALSMRPGYKRPGFEALSGRILADNDAIVLYPEPEQQVRFDYPGVFRAPIPVLLHQATIAVMRRPEGWRAEAMGLEFDTLGIGIIAEVALQFEPGGKRPVMDTAVRIKPGGPMTAAKAFWPLNTMPPRTMAWLDRAIVAGTFAGGEAVIRGDLDHWPFRDGQGRFVGRTRFVDLDLDYHPDWPAAKVRAGEVIFINEGMRAQVDAAQIGGNQIADTKASIADFRTPVLQLEGTAEGSGDSLLAFVRNSPLDAKFGSYLLGVTVGGKGLVDVALTIPLGASGGETDVEGTVRLVDADLADAKWALQFERANGQLRFTEDGFAADDLAVRLHGEPADLSLLIGEFTSNDANQTEASLRGELPLRSVMSAFDVLEPYWGRFPGRSQWTLELTVAKADKDGESATALSLGSDLVGTEIDLPAPLRKDATSRMPFTMRVELPARGGRMDMQLGGLARMRARLPDATREFAADVAFGAAEVAAPPAQGLRVHGEIPVLDLSGWGGLAGGAGPGVPIRIDLTAGELVAGGRAFHDVAIKAEPLEQEFRIDVKGPEILGRVTLPRGERIAQGVTAEFERLHLPPAVPGPERWFEPVDPSTLPPIHFLAKDLRYDAARLGEARIEAAPSATGLHFERIETTAPELMIRASGDWTLVDGVEKTRLDMTFTARSLGKMLDALGFEGLIEGGKTSARLAGAWTGSPGQFALAKIDGALSVNVGKGRILDVEPGAGRLFGLISFSSIPRRLSLDFSDFFRSGFAFDSIVGNFALRNGNANTQDLVLKGPSADIDIRGRTGLAQRDYDQNLHVVPHVGSVLPWVGALAGGPAGAAAGLVVQNVLPIKQAASARYKVQGSWEKPEITLIAKGRDAAEDRPPRATPDKPG